MQHENSEFWTGWASALDGMEAGLKTLLAINDYDGRTKPTDVILDIENMLKEVRALEPKVDLKIVS